MRDAEEAEFFDPAVPQSLAAEEAVIGAVFCDHRVYSALADRLAPESFYEPLYGRIWAAFAEIQARGSSPTLPIVAEMFANDAGLRSLGGSEWLRELGLAGSSPSAAKDYAELIVDCALRREIIWVSSELGRTMRRDRKTPAKDILEQAERRLFELGSAGGDRARLKSFAACMTEAIEAHVAASEQGRHPRAALSGLSAVDRRTGGILPKQVMLLAARPSMGKSLVGLQYAVAVARTGKPVLFFSLEMSGGEHGARALGAKLGFPYSDFLRGDLNEEIDIQPAARALAALPIWVEDSGSLTGAQFMSRTRRFIAQHGEPGLVMVDHGGLMEGQGRSDYERASDLAAAIKQTAQGLDIPTLVLLQLNRQVEGRTDKRPLLSDLRDSGKWEENAHVCAFLYRDAYYAEREPPVEDDPAAEYDRQNRCGRKHLEISIQKNRNGPVGRDVVFCDVKTGRVCDLDLAQEGSR